MSGTEDAHRRAPERRPGVTINEVARRAGVSKATVSRVLNRPEIVAPSKRKIVLQAIEQLGFQPSHAASGLKSGKYQAIALLVADVSQPWYAMMTKSVEAALDDQGYRVQLGDLGHDWRELVSYVDTIQQQGVDGAIVSTGDRLVRPALDALTRAKVPIVMAGQRLDRMGIPSVSYDDVGGARIATRHLVERYGANVAFLGLIRNSLLAGERYRGFASVLKNHHAKPRQLAITTNGYGYEAGHDAMRARLTDEDPPRAVLAANDQLALGAMRAITDHGLQIPDDVAMVGFGDTDFAPYVRPALSSVKGAVDDVARLAGKKLLALIHDQPIKELDVVPRDLVVRESS